MLLVSVFVDYDQWGRMGNRMFQYAFGYILSMQKNTELYSSGLPNFGISATNANRSPVNAINTRSYGDHYVNETELQAATNDVIVNSYVQKAQYYVQYKNLLGSIFNIKEQEQLNKDKLVLHVRETDYTQNNIFLGYEYYRSLIDNSDFTDVIIVTDNSNCDTVQRLKADGCTLNTEGYVDKFDHVSDSRAMHDFNTLLYSENIAISQSSFSWWTAFLGNHKTIIFPFTEKKSMWTLNPEKDSIDLYFNFGSSRKFIK
jgi:hypothetical protein